MRKYEEIYKTCLSVYKKAKKKQPSKPEIDYLKIVLLTKPPFDYQFDDVIDEILNSYDTIQKLSDFIAEEYKDDNLWLLRARNLKFNGSEVKERNKKFFVQFWGC